MQFTGETHGNRKRRSELCDWHLLPSSGVERPLGAGSQKARPEHFSVHAAHPGRVFLQARRQIQQGHRAGGPMTLKPEVLAHHRAHAAHFLALCAESELRWAAIRAEYAARYPLADASLPLGE